MGACGMLRVASMLPSTSHFRTIIWPRCSISESPDTFPFPSMAEITPLLLLFLTCLQTEVNLHAQAMSTG